MSNTGLKNISASRDRKGRAWRFQVVVQWNGVTLRRTILVDDYGDPEVNERLALREAITQRGLFRRDLGAPDTEVWVRSNKPGVHRVLDGHGRASWVACWKGRTRRFAVSRYGEEGARERADKARARRLERTPQWQYRGQWNAKLNPRKVRLIRAKASQGHKQIALARQLQVSRTAISEVIRGKTWTWVGG